MDIHSTLAPSEPHAITILLYNIADALHFPSQLHMAVMYLVAVENSYFYFVFFLVPMPVSLYCNYVLWSRWGSSSNR